MRSFVIVVTPAGEEFRELAHVAELPPRLRADLEALRDEVAELGLAADPRERIDIDVNRRPTMVGAGIADHTVRGRPRGTLPWVTRELLGQLMDHLEIDGDRLELEVDDERWFRYERSGGALVVETADGPDVPVRRVMVPVDVAAAAADAGWAWARCDTDWARHLEAGTGSATGAGSAMGAGDVVDPAAPRRTEPNSPASAA